MTTMPKPSSEAAPKPVRRRLTSGVQLLEAIVHRHLDVILTPWIAARKRFDYRTCSSRAWVVGRARDRHLGRHFGKVFVRKVLAPSASQRAKTDAQQSRGEYA